MVTFNPVSGAIHVTSGNTAFQIIVDFSQILAPDTVNISSFLLRLSGSSTNLSGSVFRDSTDTSRAVFTPRSGIFAVQSPATSAAYHAIVLGSGNVVGMRSIEGFFVSTVSGAFRTATAAIPPDTTAPIISGVTPLSGSTGYAVSGQPTVKFNESMTSGSMSGKIKIRVSGAGSDTAATLSLASDQVTVTIAPTGFLSGNTVYKGFVHNGVTDLAGNSLAASYTWSFTTVSPTAPIVSGTTPVSGSISYMVSGTPVVVFSTPMQSGSFSGQIKIRVSGASVDVSGTIAVSSNLTTVKITPNVMLSHCTLYRGFVHNTVREQLGVTPMTASYVWSFTTHCPTAPTIINRVPSSGSTNIAVDTTILVKFDTQMASSTLTTTNIHLRISGSSTNAAGTISVSSDLLTVVFTPTTNLAYNTTFNFYVNNTVKEVLGVTPMTATNSWSFITTLPSFTSIYNVTQTASNYNHLDDNRFRIGLRVQEGGSPLVGHTPKKVSVVMKKDGSPLSGIAYITLRQKSTDDIKTIYGTFNPSDITSSFEEYTFTNLSANYAITENDKILVEWVSGSSSDALRVAYNNTAPFAGAILIGYEGSSYSGASYENKSDDFTATLYELS